MTHSILISDARKLFAKNKGKFIHIRTIRRWIAKGVKVPGRPDPVKLRSEREGNRITTRPEWVAHFIEECNGRTEPSTVTRRSISQLEAERFLEAEGVYVRQSKGQVHGRRMQPTRRNMRSVSTVLPKLPAPNPGPGSDSRGISRSQDHEDAAISAAK